MRFKNPIGQLARWLEELQEYDMEILHREGRKHKNADGLSRIPDILEPCDCYNAGSTPETLPCGGCPYCVRAHTQWARFNQDVDYVVPLAVRCVAVHFLEDQDTDSDLTGPLSDDEQGGLIWDSRQAELPQGSPIGDSFPAELAEDQGKPTGGSLHVRIAESPGSSTGDSLSVGLGSSTGDSLSVGPGNSTGGSSASQAPKTDEGEEKVDRTELLSNWVSGYSREKIRDAQMTDSDLRPLIDWLETGKKDSVLPGMFARSPATKALWLSRKQLRIRDGVLYYVWLDIDSETFKLVVPETLRSEVLKFCHDTRSAGHFGQNKTRLRVRQTFYWYNLSRDCHLYVQGCSECNRNKKPDRKPRFALGDYQAGYPMERVHLDILGPFTTSTKSNKYVLVMVDQFTKWVELAAVPEQTAEIIATKFLAHFVSTFGCPLEVHTDQGKNFDSNLFKALCELLQIAKTRTTPYRPCSNGQVERYNKVILAFVHCYSDRPDVWDEHLPLLAMALHSMVNRSTGFTPNELMLGRNVLQPVDFLLGTTNVKLHKKTPNAWLTGLAEHLERIQKFARENLKGARKRQKRDYDLHLLENQFNEGDLVYRVDYSTKVGAKALKPVWQGPYVVERCQPPLYTLVGRRRRGVCHHDKLKLCQDRCIPLWLRRLRNKVLAPEEEPEEDDDDPLTAVAGLLSTTEVETEEFGARETVDSSSADTEAHEIVGSQPPPEERAAAAEAHEIVGSQPPEERAAAAEAHEIVGSQTPEERGNGEAGDALSAMLGTTTRSGRQRRSPTRLRDYDLSRD